MNKDGYIKFNYEIDCNDSINSETIAPLNYWRGRLIEMGLLGANADGIGFGNISKRLTGKSFVITASATGGIEELDSRHYSIITDYDFEKNYLKCKGLSRPSSESLSHAAIYLAKPEVNAVFHIHNLRLWSQLLKEFPSTLNTAQCGTPELAYAIKELVTINPELKLFALAGHEEGIISFGINLSDAGNLIINRFS